MDGGPFGTSLQPSAAHLYRRLKAKGKRGDVALGHCMRKLLHLVYAIWKTGKPFDPKHYPWIQATETQATETQATETAPDIAVCEATSSPNADNEKAVGYKRDQVPENQVVTTASSSVESTSALVNPLPVKAAAHPKIDYAYLRRQVTMEQALQHLGILDQFKGTTQQRRGPCPVHSKPPADIPPSKRTCSVHFNKNIFQCFQAECAAHGNVLDLWAAVHQLPLYDAALHLAATFRLPRNREEEPVRARKTPPTEMGSARAVITTNGG